MSLISKDENIKHSIVYIGYLILKDLSKSKNGRSTIYDIASSLNSQEVFSGEQLNYSLMFLYSLDIIEFEQPYIYVK
ncbi:hypothetical protein OA88_14515 [Flavobacterium sp. JRM]|nr:hypothetical protein OA88_14515 [Flavobacterium sp. JRM]